MHLRRELVAASVAALLAVGAAAPAGAAPAPRSYADCAQLQKVYPHGVGRQGAVDRTSGRRVSTFRVDNAVYARNDGGTPRHAGERDLDRDNDGIACEKR